MVTGSVDGVVKFWKRVTVASGESGANAGGNMGGAMGGSSSGGASGGGGAEKGGAAARCLEFVKSYSSHNGPLLTLAISQPTGDSAVSVGWDGVIKFYDVATFDVSGMIRTVAPEKATLDGSGKNCKNSLFRLGQHAALIEKEDLYLLVSTRAPTREEWQWEQREKERVQQIRQQNEDDDDDGPCPATSNAPDQSKQSHQSVIDNMVPPGSILLFSGTNLSPDPLKVITYHATPVTALAYHATKQWVVSGDVNGVLEVWSPFASAVEDSALPFQTKLATDLYALIKKRTYAIDIAVSEFGHFAIYSSDRKIRLFSLKNCKLVCIYDERSKVYDELLHKSGGGSTFMGMDAIEYGKRAALEREMEDAYLLSGGVILHPSSSSNKQQQSRMAISTLTLTSEGTHHQHLHLSFDNTGKYLLLPTIVGVKVIDIQTHRVVATIGKADASSLRFLHVCLCPGDANMDQQLQLARMGGSSAAIKHDGDVVPNDSLLIAIAYGKRRFFAFSHHDPLDSSNNEEPDEQTILARDILNEAPDASDLLEASHLGRSNNDPTSVNAQLTTATQAILRTTHGDIRIKLFPKETPKTIQNFIGHAQSGYYDNIIFHRIIPGFMVQTGDPLGDGTGGESIWGGEFEDEIKRELRHDRPFTVSMANAGPNTNGMCFTFCVFYVIISLSCY